MNRPSHPLREERVANASEPGEVGAPPTLRMMCEPHLTLTLSAPKGQRGNYK